MSFYIRRWHIERVGLADRRFDPLCLDFTDPQGAPTDSVIWAENGSGKTSVLRLVYSVVQPEKTQYLGKQSKLLRLANYVGARDTAHIVIEWEREKADGTRECLVTGLVMEWRDRRSSPDSDTDLIKRWYAFRVTEHLSLDTLPVRRDDRILSLHDFLNELQRRDRLAQSAVELRIADGPKKWLAVLSELGIDPEMFRIQVGMNEDEASADDFLDFENSERFVEKMLRIVADRESAAGARRTLGEHLGQIRNLDHYRQELRFIEQVVADLEPLAGAVAERDRVIDSQRDTVAQAASLIAALGARTAAIETEATDLRAQAACLAEDAATAQTVAGQHERNLTSLRVFAADTRHRQAEAGVEDAKVRRGDANISLRGRRAVADVIARDRAEAELAAVDAQIAEREAASRPIRDRLAQHARRLLDLLQGERRTREARGVEAEARATAAEKDGVAAQTAADALVAEGGRLDGDEQHAKVTLADTQQAVDAVVADHLAESAEDIDAARARLAEEQGHDRVRSRWFEDEETELDRRAKKHHDREIALAERRAAAHQAQPAATASLKAFHDARSKIAFHARLRQHAATEEPLDPYASATFLAAQIAAAVATGSAAAAQKSTDRARIEADLAAIAKGSLLPGGDDVREVLAILEGAGLTASTGWRYISETVSERRSDATVVARPDLASGVVLHSGQDLHTARAVLEEAGYRPGTTAVVVGRPAEVAAAESGDVDPTRIVVPPSRALYDAKAAALCIEDLESRRDVLRAEEERLQSDLDADRAARATLRDFLEAYPEGTQARLAGEVAAADAEVARCASEEKKLAEEAAGIVESRGRTRAGQKAIADRALARATAEERLAAAARAQQRAATAHEELTRIASRRDALAIELTRIRERSRQAAVARESALRDVQIAGNDLRTVDEEIREWKTSLGPILSAASAGSATTARLEEVRLHVKRLHEEYQHAIPDEELRRDRERAAERLGMHTRNVEKHEEQVRQRAREFADENLSVEGQEAAIDAAARALDDAAAEEVRWTEERALAKQARGDFTEESYADPVPLPQNLDEAHRLIEEEQAETQRRNTEYRQLDEAAKRAAGRATEATGTAALYRASARRVDQGLADESDVPSVIAEPFEGTSEEADAIWDQLLTSLRSSRTAMAKVDDQIKLMLNKVAITAAEQTGVVADRQKVRLLRQAASDPSFPGRAGELLSELGTTALDLRADIEEAQRSRTTVLTALGSIVQDAIHDLEMAARVSQVRPGLGAWSGERFLNIVVPEKPASQEVLHERLGRFIDERGEAVANLSAETLLARALGAAVNHRYVVTILKPEAALTVQYHPIEELVGWSGGEKITVAILLYCTFARMRGRTTGRRQVPQRHGVLILDNPMGKVSSVTFLEVMRAVAESNGIQLIFTTHVNDWSALAVLPNRIRLKRQVGTGGSKYVRVEKDGGTVDEIQLLPARVQRVGSDA